MILDKKIRGIENRKLNTSYLLLYLCGITKEKDIVAFLRLLILKCVYGQGHYIK